MVLGKFKSGAAGINPKNPMSHTAGARAEADTDIFVYK